MNRTSYIPAPAPKTPVERLVDIADAIFDRATKLDGIKLDKLFEEKASGKDTKRPVLAEALRYLRDGDTLIVHDISRLARNLGDLLSLVKGLTERGVTVQFQKEALTFQPNKENASSDLMLNLLGAVYQFERSILLERQREGIAKAKQAGKYRGRVADA